MYCSASDTLWIKSSCLMMVIKVFSPASPGGLEPLGIPPTSIVVITSKARDLLSVASNSRSHRSARDDNPSGSAVVEIIVQANPRLRPEQPKIIPRQGPRACDL